ncbi:MAG: hypothetical protein ACRC6V_07740 [Bacteroidales bacterium]
MSDNVIMKDPTTGRFLAGNNLAGSRKGSRNKMTQLMLDRVSSRSEDGLSMEEIMMDIAQDPNQPAELRFKAAAKISDLVYPKAASVEVQMDENAVLTKGEMDARLKQLLSAQFATVVASETSDEDLPLAIE